MTVGAATDNAARARCFRVFLRYDGTVLRVEVHDSGPGMPRIADRADEGGRGLLLVAAFADRWGVDGRNPGKAVWCEFGEPVVPTPLWPKEVDGERE